MKLLTISHFIGKSRVLFEINLVIPDVLFILSFQDKYLCDDVTDVVFQFT